MGVAMQYSYYSKVEQQVGGNTRERQRQGETSGRVRGDERQQEELTGRERTRRGNYPDERRSEHWRVAPKSRCEYVCVAKSRQGTGVYYYR